MVPGSPATYSFGPWRVGRGNNRPAPSGSDADNSGVWSWDKFVAGESDSLQGWWPMRRIYTITGGLTLADTDRPWWAVDVGNQGNYVLDAADGRTFGVLSYWHADGGNHNNMLRIQTIGTASNRDGIGARVEVSVGGAKLWQRQAI